MLHNPPQSVVILAFVLLFVAVILGAPVFVALGGAALFFLWNSDTPISSIPAETYRMVVNPTIPTIPLFTLTGLFFGRGRGLQTPSQGLPGPIRVDKGRTGHRDLPGLRLLHHVHRRFRRHHPGPGRAPHAHPDRRKIHRKKLAGASHFRRFPGTAFSPQPAGHPLRRGFPHPHR